jgi:7,8-dihydropterin-6-yl-methyl-4-(beta-D-ribofuranosyl)aminobenzene 5'-phosphate synthase
MSCGILRLVMFGMGLLAMTCGCRCPPVSSPDGTGDDADTEAGAEMTITIVYDNNSYEPALRTAWGFACVVELEGSSILFDTGGDGRLLLSNMRKLRIDPEAIDMVVLSHAHGDHVGGLAAFLRENHDVRVYMPASFPESLFGEVRHSGAQVKQIKGPQELARNVYTTGELDGGIPEQSLVLRTEAGLAVVTGCAHPGVIHILEQSKQVVSGDIALAMGGFHLGGTSESQIDSIVRRAQELGVRFVAPCHCSGALARKKFGQAYGNRYLPAGVGYRISSETLLPRDGPLPTNPPITGNVD